MSLKKQIENYFESIQDLSGNIIYFDEMPEKKLKKNDLTVVNTRTEQKVINNLADNVSKNICSNINLNDVINNDKINNNVDKDISNTMNTKENMNNNINIEHVKSLQELNDLIKDCKNCDLGKGRINLVFGKGNPKAKLMIIGEAPGQDEDLKGEPFVGRAGQLLTKILAAINFSREEVYIANICKCRPPGNRKPNGAEVFACERYLQKQIELISPNFILLLGLTAADTLFKKTHKMSEIRGKILYYNGIKTLITYHPSALLRNPNWKKDTWVDVQLLRKLYDEEMLKQQQ